MNTFEASAGREGRDNEVLGPSLVDTDLTSVVPEVTLKSVGQNGV